MARKALSVDAVLRRAKRWDGRYLRVTLHAVEVSDADDDRKAELIDEFLSYSNRHAFKATNPFSKQMFLPAVLDALLKDQERLGRRTWGREYAERHEADDIVFAMVTFSDVGWACSDRDIEFDLGAAKQKVRNALRGVDFLARFEAAHYVNEYHVVDGVKGNLILFHCHALVWASSHSKLKRMRQQMHARFKPVAWAKTGMRLQRVPVEDVPRVVGYIAKMHTLGYRHLTDGKSNRQDHAAVRPGSRYRFFSHMRQHSLFDFWFAGGEGKVPLRKARKHLVSLGRPALRVSRLRRSRRDRS